MQQSQQELQRYEQQVRSFGQQSHQGGSQGGGSSQWGSGSGGGGTQTLSRQQVVTWNQIQQQGCYVDVVTGDIYRIPYEALVNGQMPIIKKESTRLAAKLMHISGNPFLPTEEAVALAQQFAQQQVGGGGSNF